MRLQYVSLIHSWLRIGPFISTPLFCLDHHFLIRLSLPESITLVATSRHQHWYHAARKCMSLLSDTRRNNKHLKAVCMYTFTRTCLTGSYQGHHCEKQYLRRGLRIQTDCITNRRSQSVKHAYLQILRSYAYIYALFSMLNALTSQSKLKGKERNAFFVTD